MYYLNKTFLFNEKHIRIFFLLQNFLLLNYNLLYHKCIQIIKIIKNFANFVII